jgi:predicted nucleic acid-binding protein
MIVVETELIAGLYLPTEFTGLAEELYEKDPYWLAPFLWRSEFLSVVSIYLSKNLINLDKASEAVELAERQMKHREYRAVAYDVLEKATESGFNTRDCEYISLASFSGFKLVTLDEKILKKYPDIAVHPKHFAPNN